jgi:hypothetical protein
MSLILLSYASLLIKEGIGMRKKPKGGLASSIPWPVAGWVCYITEDHWQSVPISLKYLNTMCGTLMAIQPMIEVENTCFFQ